MYVEKKKLIHVNQYRYSWKEISVLTERNNYSYHGNHGNTTHKKGELNGILSFSPLLIANNSPNFSPFLSHR
jgi:hypothetical protein